MTNEVVVNKIDLVSEDQKSDIIEKIGVLNPSAKVIESIQSKVKASEILDTRLYKASDQVLIMMALTKSLPNLCLIFV